MDNQLDNHMDNQLDNQLDNHMDNQLNMDNQHVVLNMFELLSGKRFFHLAMTAPAVYGPFFPEQRQAFRRSRGRSMLGLLGEDGVIRMGSH